jgi:glutathione S-transferase
LAANSPNLAWLFANLGPWCAPESLTGKENPMALKLYGVYRSRATRNIWLLNELKLPFEHIPVIQSYRLAKPKAKDSALNTASRKFLKVNPNGKVPSLKDGRLVLHESLAINLYLAKKYGKRSGTALGPKNVAEEGQMAMWALWAVTEVEPHSLNIMYHRVSKPEAERDPAVATAAIEHLQRPLNVLEGHLAANGGYVLGGRFTVADINTAEVVRYAQAAPELFAERPHLKKWIEACQARPAYKDMMAKRNAEPM